MGWGDSLIGLAKNIGDGFVKVGGDVVDSVKKTGQEAYDGAKKTTEAAIGIGKQVADLTERTGEQVFKATKEVVLLPEKIYHEYADDKPHSSEYNGAPGRHHKNETVIHGDSADYNDNERQVQLACRVVAGGAAGETFGMATKLWTDTLTIGQIGTVAGVPNSTYHWCILVGDNIHQLQCTSMNGGWNYYTNARINRITGGWNLYNVGSTKLNDVAIRDVSTKVMNEMDEVYSALNNICQTFSLRLVDKILTTARTKKYLQVNLTYGLQNTKVMNFKDFPRATITRIDDGEEVVEPEVVEPEVAPGTIEEEPVPVVVEELPAHGDAVEVAEAEDTMPRTEMLIDITKIMIAETPTLRREDVEVAGKTEAETVPAQVTVFDH